MKLRLPGRPRAAAAPDPAADLTAQQLVAAGKGRPTPKRAAAQGRRQGPVPPPPTTRKEAYRRQREQAVTQKATGRGAALRGDDSDLPARDRGPARKLVRDIVDSRRNVGSVFLLLAVFLILGLVVPSEAFKSYSSLVALGFFAALVIDSFALRRTIKRRMAERLPNATDKQGSLVWYGISRSTMIRRWRFPKAQVGLGDDI